MTGRHDSGATEASRRPEEEILLRAVRASIARKDIGPLTALLGDSLDWEYVIRAASRHQILPMVCRILISAGEAVPLSVRSLVQHELDTRPARNRQLATELIRLLRLAAAENIALLPFKGPVLAAAIYGDLALRQFADLDILIDPTDRTRVEQLLRPLGYVCRVDHGWEAEFVHPDGGVTIDLHVGLTPMDFPVPLVFSRLWARRQGVMLAGQPVETLCTEDLLVVLCIQLARDAWQGKTRLGKICDLGQLLHLCDRMRWERVEAEARALRVRRVVEFGIALATQVLQLPATPPAHGTDGHRGIRALVRQETKALFDDPKAPPPSRIRGDLLHYHLRERWRDRLAPYRLHGVGVLTPTEKDRATLALPGRLSWLHYVVRPVRVLRQYGRYLMGRGFD